MQTVHIWSVDHLLLENNLDVRKARKEGAAEVLVVIHNGKVVEVMPPANGEGEFRGRQDLVEVISRSWARGRTDVLKGLPLGPNIQGLLHQSEVNQAPEGWILWQNLEPGMLAYDGHDQHVLRFVVPFEHTAYHGSVTSGFGLDRDMAAKRTSTTTLRDLVWLGSEKTTESVGSYIENRTHDPYLKVIRQGLTQEQCIEIRAMCRDDNYAAFRPSYVL